MQQFRKWYVLLSALAICAAVSILVSASNSLDSIDPLVQPAQLTSRAAHSVLLDITHAGARLVAVGERGIIVLSDDSGKTWRQAKVPMSDSLTAVTFVNPKAGWAVGHSGVVLHSEDGGETWAIQFDGNRAAQLALESAQADIAKRPTSPQAQQLLADAQRLVQDGPDKPFLAVCFEDEQTGFVAGAYGIIFRTGDGGRSWEPWMDRLDNPKGFHINAIKAVGNNIYLAGEQGLFLRSYDKGNTFTRVETPYKGSYFTIALGASGEVVLAGMRGNAYRSVDQGKTFTQVEIPVPVTIGTSTTLKDGALLFLNQAGQILRSDDRGRTVRVVPASPLPPSGAILEDEHGLWSAGVVGVVPFAIDESISGNAGKQ